MQQWGVDLGRQLLDNFKFEISGNQMKKQLWALLLLLALNYLHAAMALPHRILVDTDVDTDDLFALLYLLKLDTAQFDLQAVTINADGWSDAGHAVNHVYDLLHMMGRDDIRVGVGGEGAILEDGTVFPNVGGYLPLIEQGNRQYYPVQQATAQQVMIDVISEAPTSIFMMGAHTNFAIFLMSNPDLKKNVNHVYFMGGGIRSKNRSGCCPVQAGPSCQTGECGDPGNLFTDYTSNPFAEFNIFLDPFAAYQVIHSGIPVTMVPLDATNTIPITKHFFDILQQNQTTYEAQYVFKSLQMVHDSVGDDSFYTSFFMWDSFMAAVAVSIMSKPVKFNGENDFAKMEYMNITVVTSNKPYGISDGSNPFFDGREIPKFHLQKGDVHSGHVQKGLRDPFCISNSGKGKCQDGYTMETTGPEAVHVLAATEAKPNKDPSSPLNREFFVSFLEVLNRRQRSGRFNLTTQFPHYKEIYYRPNFTSKNLGKAVVFDMDMSAGDFIALFYLLKVPVEVVDVKAVLVTPTGWASAATIDVVYDLLHMMGRDDIPVGLGDVFAMNQTDPIFSGVGYCQYIKAIPHGSGGLVDSDTLYGLARQLPRSPRRYTSKTSVDHPKIKQPSALEIWENDVYIVGGYINYGAKDRGNVFTVPSNEHAEFNMFLDPLAAKTVFNSKLNITLIPLGIQRSVSSFSSIQEAIYRAKSTPEVLFSRRLLSLLRRLQEEQPRYRHMDMYLGEILGAVIMAGDDSDLNSIVKVQPITVLAPGTESIDGQMVTDEKHGKPIKVIENVDHIAYYNAIADRLGDEKQSAVMASFDAQKRSWS
ncbi:hypothetical protein Nepgr_010188 [Nepenthes gracilis]|uniref:Inosine/uridine-preferring nucleoside hydrolase domain-containing protein n=1 Tax=Nepenthes gracilis TaxID=150966 RepID=A0AAD3SC12_NEPGR|nr:hypothetical protein Nepgr_010188 [Nepenthes gracilis]